MIAVTALGADADTELQKLRLHGDVHPGNILWTPTDRPDGGPHFVDLDDARTGFAVQDLWMLLSGDRAPAHRPARRPARRLRAVPRLRPARAGADRAAAHPAPDPLQRLARAALARSDLPDQLPLVRLERLLEGADPDAAGPVRGDGGGAAVRVSCDEALHHPGKAEAWSAPRCVGFLAL